MNNKQVINSGADINARISNLNRKFEIDGAISKVLLGKILSKFNQNAELSLKDAEFRVFSQFGDDGIIQHLINKLGVHDSVFIEFGVENYNEANTRFLLENNNWRGLVIDADPTNIEYIKNTQNYWRHDLTALCSFVTAENINSIISDAGFIGNIGLLHIDIDGNDYWIWRAITVVRPAIVIVEYNSLFGPERSITIPYDPNFSRHEKHHSGLYAGASLRALCQLASEKGYNFVGANSAGNNAYFVIDDLAGIIPSLRCEDGYVLAKFREHRNEQGQLTFTPGISAVESIRGMPVFNILTQQLEDL
ncbi:NADH dehydrogenase [Aeromonas bestiarum]|uniref:NADH dehydrogenase n=1 Tax=Aeromonas bestiarum TaxID=105751 RepID=UPI0009B903F4|nr:NADH dehydrogenase [Aeromonas bestiarum]